MSEKNKAMVPVETNIPVVHQPPMINVDVSKMTDDQLLAFAEMAGDDAPTWEADEGEGIVGVVIKRGMVDTRNDKPCGLVVLIDSKTGEPVSIWESTVLASKFTQLGIQPGDKIAVRRLKDRISKEGGRTYKNYAVVLAGRGVAPITAATPSEPDEDKLPF